MAALLTLAEAKLHLRVTGSDDDADIMAKTLQASDLVVKHLDAGAVVGWTDITAPGNVKAATCLVLAYLFEHRGDDMAPSAEIWQAVERVLTTTRVSALA